MTTAPIRSPQNARLGALTLVLVIFWTTIAVYSVHAVLPYNPIRLPFARVLQARAWAPQGWNFFTRAAREPDLAVLRHDGSVWRAVPLGLNSSAETWFGVKRQARARGIEAGLILFAVKDRRWTSCNDAPVECVTRAPLMGEVPNATPVPTLCGELALVRQEPVPWAWNRSAVIMPSNVMRVIVRC